MMFVFSKLQAARVATEMSYHAARRSQNDVHKSKLGNVALICINLAFNKLKATRLATEILYYATKRHWNEDHKAKLRTVVLCSRLASSKLRGFQQKCPIVTLSKSQAARVATDAFFSIPLPSLENTKKCIWDQIHLTLFTPLHNERILPAKITNMCKWTA